MASVLEMIMLICFGASWPLNAIKSYRARTAKATSLPFLLLITTGYVAGIIAKFISENINYVLVIYFLDLGLVLVNLAIYLRNRKLDADAANVSNVS